MPEDKVAFLKTAFVPLLKNMRPDIVPLWGQMTVQHMIEHVADAVRIASGNAPGVPLFTPEKHLPKMQAFLRSDKPMTENFRNPLMPQTPGPVRHATMQGAIDELQRELDAFFDTFAATSGLRTHNPFFGALDYELNVHLLYKHAQHHLRQFGVAVG